MQALNDWLTAEFQRLLFLQIIFGDSIKSVVSCFRCCCKTM